MHGLDKLPLAAGLLAALLLLPWVVKRPHSERRRRFWRWRRRRRW